MKKIIRWLDVNLEPVLMAILFASMILLVFLQVILRFFFQSGFSWGEELARIIFVWLSFISFGYLTRNSRHVRIGFFRERFSESVQKVILFLCDLLFLVFVIVAFKAAIVLCVQTVQFGDRLVTLNISSNLFYFAGFFGFLIMLVRSIQTIVWKLKHWNQSLEVFENYDGVAYPNNQICFIPKEEKGKELNHPTKEE